MRKTIEYLWFKPYTPILFFIVLLFVAYRFFYPGFQKTIGPENATQTISITPQAPVLGDESSILTAVSKLIRLPADEKPLIRDITNVDEFKEQPFFRQAKNGDILLIYQNNRKVILYDPKANIIIDTAPIAASDSGSPSASDSGF